MTTREVPPAVSEDPATAPADGLSVERTAQELNVSVAFVERLVREATIPCRVNGLGELRVPADAVARYRVEDDARRRRAADALTALDEELDVA